MRPIKTQRNKKINVFFLLLSLNVGGTERHILNLILKLNKEKFNPVICCLNDLGSMGVKFANNNKGINVYKNIISNKFDLYGIWKLFWIIKKEKVDVLFTINSPLTQLWGTLLAYSAGISTFITRVCATNPSYHGRRREIVNMVMLPFVDRVIAQADIHKDHLVASEGMKKDKIEVIYNGVELERFSGHYEEKALRKKIGISTEAPVIGIVARLAVEKGHVILLKAAKKIINEFPEACFLIVGDGPEREKIETAAREFAIESNVYLLGTRNDIPQILSIIDIAVLSSEPVVETLSNAILEYMAAGKPVVATNVGSMADLVKDGETGLLVPYGKPDILSEAILDLLENPDKLDRMGKAGRERIKELFTLEKMVANYETLFERLVAQ